VHESYKKVHFTLQETKDQKIQIKSEQTKFTLEKVAPVCSDIEDVQEQSDSYFAGVAARYGENTINAILLFNEFQVKITFLRELHFSTNERSRKFSALY
jgi:hypothetical protein